MTHGLRGSQLPKGAKSEEFAIYSFRRELRVALVAIRGAAGPSFVDESLIQTAVRHETRARLAARWLRMEKEPSLADRLSLLDTISNATEARDKVIRQLGIAPNGKDGNGSDPWAEFDQSRKLEALPQAPIMPPIDGQG